jgi:DNA invertase Pin-like site-specific DNA recombinase
VRAAGYYRPQTTDARSEQAAVSAIERYCLEGFHTLSRVVGPGEPPLRDADQYGALVSYLEGLGRGEALIVIPDPRHLASTLDGLVSRLTELDSAGGEVRCADPDRPDPLQHALESLPFAGRPAAQNRRVRESLLSKAARGEVLGRTPYGYVADIDGTFKVEEIEARLVRRLFDLYAGDAPSEESEQPAPLGGPGLRRIAGILNAEGSHTRTGRPWSPVTLSGMLRNRVYTGSYLRYGMRIAGNHERIVARDVFNRAQEVMASRSPDRKRRSLTPYLLSGLARCWSCGRGMHGIERQRQWSRADGSGASRSYRYYVCPSRSAGVTEADVDADGEVLHPSWREAELDRAALGALRDESAEVLRSSFVPVADDEANNEIQAAEQQFLESVRSVASGRGGVSDLITPLEELRTTRSMSQASSTGFTFEDAMDSIQTAEPNGLHAAVASLVERIVVHDGRVEPVYRTS